MGQYLLSSRKVKFIVTLIAVVCVLTATAAIADVNIAELMKRVSPSVVSITPYDARGIALSYGAGFFFPSTATPVVPQAGSGVKALPPESKPGGSAQEVVTSYNVIEGAWSVSVETHDGESLAVQGVVAVDKEAGLVKLLVDTRGKNYPAVQLGSTEALEVGQRIVAIESPGGLEGSVLEGQVSAIREEPGYGKVMEISVGRLSGSPILNVQGQVVGIARRIYKEGQFLTFFVPVEKIASLETGKVLRLSEVLGGGAAQSKDAENLYRNGWSYFKLGQYKEAIQAFEEAIRLKPDYAEAYLGLGWSYGQLGGDYNKTIEALKEAIRLKPDFAKAYQILGWVYFENRHFKEAEEASKEAIRLKPDYPEARQVLGIAYYRQYRYREAEEVLKEAIRLKPDYPEAHRALGMAYFGQEKYKEAEEVLKEAIRLKPDYAAPYETLGWVYYKQGQYKEAVEAAKEAIRLQPDFPGARQVLDESIEAAKEAIRLKPESPEADRALSMAMAYYGQKKYKEAEEALKEAIRLKPDYAQAYLGLGRVYYGRNRYKQAVEALKEAIRLKPDYAQAYLGLGWVYGKLGADYKKAVEAFKEAIRIRPDYAAAYLGLGIAYLQQERSREALAAFKEVARIDPNSVYAHAGLGAVYMQMGDRRKAMEEQEIVKKLAPEHATGSFGVIMSWE